MKTRMTVCEIEAHAEKALTQALLQISYAKLKDIEYASAESGQPRGNLAHVEVLGRCYLLTCVLERDGKLAYGPARVRNSGAKLQGHMRTGRQLQLGGKG